MTKIRIGIVGFGNLGKGVEEAISFQKDMELKAIFSRREIKNVRSGVPVVAVEKAVEYKYEIDVMILCGGSATDLPVQGAKFASNFHTVDSFDNHARIPEYFEKIHQSAMESGKLSLISTGWDPGLFSLMRVLGEAVLPLGKTYTFWGRGLSQGHSDAIRRIPGVKKGAQYTVPNEGALQDIRDGKQPDMVATEMHHRICYVVAEEGADQKKIATAIKTMPHYFAPYHTEVHFISDLEFDADHQKMPHGGKVLRSGISATEENQLLEFGLSLNSNPQFTASVLVAYARAVYRMSKEGKTGAVTVFDIPIGHLSAQAPEILRKEFL